MKTAILTLPLHSNYGGILQNFALQEALKQEGHDPCTVLFRKSAGYKLKHPLSVWLKQHNLLPYKHAYPFTDREKAVVRKYTDRFINEYINYTEPVSSSQLRKMGFAAFIAGSDQIWRRYRKELFLGFLSDKSDARRVAYSASFAVGHWPFSKANTEKAARLAKRFDSISVREGSAVEICRDYLGVEAVHMPDPTMLHPKEFYYTLIKDRGSKNAGAGSLGVYVLDRRPETDAAVNRVCSELSLSENWLMPASRPGKNVPLENCLFPSMEEWLDGLGRADFIVTDSFHGTVFALIFNRPFIAICNSGRGAERFQSLLADFGLRHRLIEPGQEITSELLSEKIDFDKVNETLANLREKGFAFLRESLG